MEKKKMIFGIKDILSRDQMKQVRGGSADAPQCGNSGSCLTSSCTASSGVCQGKPGTCGGTTTCSCAAVC
jgi:hypothetical protein